jgi:hypothetical protein
MHTLQPNRQPPQILHFVGNEKIPMSLRLTGLKRDPIFGKKPQEDS